MPSAGALAPGPRITQEDIAEQLSMSRQPVPQALRLLKMTRLLQDAPGRFCRANLHAHAGLPLGLAHGVKVLRPAKTGQSLCGDDVAMDTSTWAWQLRNQLEELFGSPLPKAV